MSAACDIARAEVANGVAAALRGVDCVSAEMTQAAFGRMFSPGGGLGTALTILLTLYVGFFAISLLTGRSRIGVSALTPRMILLGMVLTFATSWVAYQSVVWNLATGAPDEIASLITGSDGSATTLFADKIDIAFGAIAEATKDQTAAASAGTFAPPNLVWFGATLLLLGTVGVLVTARIALAVLVALGPVFVVLALFGGTRGLFVGWLRGLTMLALAPLFAVLGGSLMLELAVPIIGGLVAPTGGIEPRAAMALFLVGAVHVALVMLVLRTAGTMVAGWRVFGLAGPRTVENSAPAVQSPPRIGIAAPAASTVVTSPSAAASAALAGRTAIVTQTGITANDAGVRRQRETRLDPRGVAIGQPMASGVSRARGVGSRYRSYSSAPFSEKSQ